MFFMSPDPGAGSGAAPATDPKLAGEGAAPGKDVKPAQAQGSDAGKDDADIPTDPEKLKALLKQERDAHQHTISVHTEMKTKWTKREAEEAKAREEALKKQGQFEALYNEAAPKVQTLEALNKRQEAALASYLDAELKGVPEAMRPLIPDGDAVSKLEWITKAKVAGAFGAAAAGSKGKGPDGTPPPGAKGATMPEAEFKMLSPKDRAAFMAKGGTIV